MLGYFKAEPTEFARMSVNGRMKKEGQGIAGFYLPFRTTIELVSVALTDQGFVFTETTNDKQELTLQGGFIYRITDPGKTLGVYNFAIDPKTKQYLTEDPVKLPEQVLQLIRANARRIVQEKPLEELLVMSDELSTTVAQDMPNLADLGVEVRVLYFAAIQPTPEIAKALGAEYREGLLQKADKAMYERRATAVQQEKAIQENELKNKTELEQQRAQLVELQGKNTMQEAQYKADAAKLEMGVFAEMSPETIRAHALYQLGKNAARIETLTVTPEILAGLAQR